MLKALRAKNSPSVSHYGISDTSNMDVHYFSAIIQQQEKIYFSNFAGVNARNFCTFSPSSFIRTILEAPQFYNT